MKDEAQHNFLGFLLACGEGYADWMYLDERGIVTTGIGCALFTPGTALELDWRRHGGSVASEDEVRRAYATVQARRELAGHGGLVFATVTSLRATQASISALIQRVLERFEARLRADWPGWDDAPWQAQEALMRLAWACGESMAPRWPKLHAAWVARDWEACASECRLPALDRTEPGANEAEAALFREAAAIG